ncbi:NAD(P)H-hydrate dehydratase [Phyllobacterium endophyticum]|uniref:NAD(P)H-hydrate dehydratase n=1 Tax=Phyllobacterium endophyticum TaxID=1149773 RepID=UPI0011C86B80|nr:NAD(P)H-hydrate dehydratase [Phyllobacterium endophyticum]TXR46483.1 NAD(P)H-hydrate dehydratase [Phyllobacterium endophyticum]
MAYEILTPVEMGKADKLTIAAGPYDGYGLMLNAGSAIAHRLLADDGDASAFHILCGPGNNGGDGYVVARLLAESGASVHVWSYGKPAAQTDAAMALQDCPVQPRPIAEFQPTPGSVIVDALFAAGLNKAVTGEAAEAIERANAAAARRVAVDIPSGLDGLTGLPLGPVFHAGRTITFFRKKPGHLLYPGRTLCGELVVADIGIRKDVLAAIKPRCFENTPHLWCERLPAPEANTHKYKRGHVAVFSGGATATGAARLSALAAARAGAGAVTVLSPGEALAVNAAHLTSIMLARCDHNQDLQTFVETRKASAFVLGPGFGIGERARAFALALLGYQPAQLVFDADAITSFEKHPDVLFHAAGSTAEIRLVLTPHEGEFKRLFPDIAGSETGSKVERAREAAARAHAIIIYKGADTVIASPDGRAAINTNGTPLLATAGSGDVLAGLVASLMAQGMPPFEAACAAVFIHAAAARSLGFGLIAEDLPAVTAIVLGDLMDDWQQEKSARNEGVAP